MVDAVVLYPIQTATNLPRYETGYYDADDVRRLGIGMLLLTMIFILLTKAIGVCSGFRRF